MWTDNDSFEALEAYAEGRMSGEEQRAFELRLAEDRELSEQLSEYRSTRRAIAQSNEDDEVRKLLKKSEERISATSTNWLRWAAAAAVLILIGTAAWMLSRSSTSLPALAEKYAVEEQALPVFMTVPNDHSNELDRSMQFFGAGRYDEALVELGRLPPTDTVAFYAGLCTMRLGRDPSLQLRSVGEDTTSTYRGKALYHLMLWCMTKERQVEAGTLLQEQLSISVHPYRAQLDALAASHVFDR